MQQELGDLEQLEHDMGALYKVLRLPHLALLQLLSNPATRAASENTVAFIIQRWADSQQPQPLLEQMRQLTSQIRMRQCTALFASTCLFAWPLLEQCFTEEEHRSACMIAATPAGAGPQGVTA